MLPAIETVTAKGRYFDGLSARPHPVTLRLGHRLEVAGHGIRLDWGLFELRAAESLPPLMRVGPADGAARVEFSDETLARALEARAPDLHRSESGEGSVLRLVLWSIAAGVSVLLVAVFGVPAAAGLIVPLVPEAVEARFGQAVDGQVVNLLGKPLLCEAPAGRAALDRLVAKMTAGANLREAPQVAVRRHKVANALTLPGGRVIVLSDIIEKAKTPDEFAAILGHEFGHVAARDPTRSVIAAGGTSFLLSLILGDLTGSTILVTVGQVAISAGYSREAERAADAYGVAMMRRAGGDPAALASILERIDDEPDDKGKGTSFLRSHPYTKERAATIRGLAGAATGQRILSDEDWTALRAICPAKPAREPETTAPPEKTGGGP